MTNQSTNTLDKIFSQLSEPSTSPEKALQLLSTSFFIPEAYSESQKEPILIFLAYASFIMNNQPGGKVEGIWEMIGMKTFMYLRRDYSGYYDFISEFTSKSSPKIFAWQSREGPSLGEQLANWTVKVLSTPRNCPSPYVRLEIFRLYIHFVRKSFIKGRENEIKCIKTFIYTICEVNPYCFHPSGEGYDPMFSAGDLNVMLCRKLEIDNFYRIKDHNFLSSVIQLIGVFASLLGNDPEQYEYIICCSNVLNNLSHMSDKLTHQPIRKYMLETAREITATVIYNKGILTEDQDDMISCRNSLIEGLSLSNKSSDLPRLLLLRQIHDSKQVRQYSLLLPNLQSFFKKDKDTEFNINSDTV